MGTPSTTSTASSIGDPIVMTTLQGIFVYDTTKSQVVCTR